MKHLRPARIFLVGLMGAGKSTVGRALARRLGWAYRDNDMLLRAQTGLAAPTLADQGREALHTQESRQLRALVEAPPPFVAGVAASVADYPDDLALVANAGHVVYLRTSPEKLAERVGAGAGRPWLQDPDPLTVLRRQMAQRDGIYKSLGYVVNTGRRDPDDIAAELAARFIALLAD